jgi:hypothetical protein
MRLFVLLLVSFCAGCLLSSSAQINLGNDRWKLDTDRHLLLSREKELLRSCDELQRRHEELEQSMAALKQERNRIEAVLRQARTELNRIRLELL